MSWLQFNNLDDFYYNYKHKTPEVQDVDGIRLPAEADILSRTFNSGYYKYLGTFQIGDTKVSVDYTNFRIEVYGKKTSCPQLIKLSAISRIDCTRLQSIALPLFKEKDGSLYVDIGRLLRLGRLPGILPRKDVQFQLRNKSYVITKAPDNWVPAPEYASIFHIKQYHLWTEKGCNTQDLYLSRKGFAEAEQQKTAHITALEKKYPHIPPTGIDSLWKESYWERYNKWRADFPEHEPLPQHFLHPVVERYVHKNIRGLVSRRFGQTLVPKEWLREPMAVLHDFRVVKDNKILFFFLRELAKDPKLYRALSIMLI